MAEEQLDRQDLDHDRPNPESQALTEPQGGHLADRLVELMALLRGPDGCPWDRAQDYDSMKALLLEEAYEVIDAVNQRDFAGLEDELGDLLFQVVFCSRLAEEEGRFTLADVMERLYSKLVRRHPHVFGERKARNAEEALKSWNAVKEKERNDARRQNSEGSAVAQAQPGAGDKSEQESLLDGIAETLPSTLEAHELGVRVAEVGFDWPRAANVLDKVEEELGELKQELRKAEEDCVHVQARGRIEEELGDLLFSLSQLARHLGTDPESCLRRGNQKFRSRFQALERELARRGRRPGDCDLEELEAVWNDVKRC
ncbi:MAG TPA: nucleoside triphosphate pyrophosphohydrolase [Terriglobia bacterium]|nr:nucleoside triphosphate pyrophosphohydrolase [Terriglobia bacterium]